jgi:hypothetical protein
MVCFTRLVWVHGIGFTLSALFSLSLSFSLHWRGVLFVVMCITAFSRMGMVLMVGRAVGFMYSSHEITTLFYLVKVRRLKCALWVSRRVETGGCLNQALL